MKSMGFLVLLPFLASLAAAPAAGKKEPPKDEREQAAIALVDYLAAGEFAKAAEKFDSTMKEALPPERLRGVWKAIQEQAGAFQKRTGLRKEKADTHQIIYVRCQFERAPLETKVVFDADGKIAGLFFIPAPPEASGRFPDYVRPEAFREVAVNVGEGGTGLPGTLSLPDGDGPFPGLVLVHGSGPLDRDETIGPNKPFRDLAAGLASRGIAVLRYDKRTFARPGDVAAPGVAVTLEQEIVADVLNAVRLLRATERIDPRRVFVLGHSLGGVALPRVGARDPGIAGLILAAAPSRALEDTLLEQVNYIASLDGSVSGEERAELEKLQKEIARLKDPGLAASADPGDLPLGLSREYWLDLHRSQAPAAAAALGQPLLVVQGGRDYQVTVADLEGWKKALAQRQDVEFRLYPGLNHLFMAGEGKSTPAEYLAEGHVARAVIEDVAAWIRSSPARGSKS